MALTKKKKLSSEVFDSDQQLETINEQEFRAAGNYDFVSTKQLALPYLFGNSQNEELLKVKLPTYLAKLMNFITLNACG